MKRIKISVLTSLYNCSSYLEGYFSSIIKLSNTEDIEVLLLHNAPTKEELLLIENFSSQLPFIKHIQIPQREGLYATWNRGIKLAQGEYIAIWNVDDIRLPDSLEIQANALDENPNAAIAYGDIIGVKHYGDTEGTYYHQIEHTKGRWALLRSHCLGCFPMWRASIHEKIGYFDEQFKAVADFEFQVRCVRSFPLIKVAKILGYFLEYPAIGVEKLSFAKGNLQDIERTGVEVRYGQFDKINLIFLAQALNTIDISGAYWQGKRHEIQGVFTNYKSFIIARLPLWLGSIFRLPVNLARYVKKHLF